LSKERNVRHVFAHAGCSLPNHTASQWLDLAEGRLRLDRLAATAAQNFLPLGVPPIPRETRKFRAPVLHYVPAASGAAAIASGLQIAIEAAVVAGSKQQGDETWLTLVLSRNPAPNSRAKSSP
jgi:hypothetical protein